MLSETSMQIEFETKDSSPNDEVVCGLDEDSSPPSIDLVSSTGKRFTVKANHAKISKLIAAAVEGNEDTTEILISGDYDDESIGYVVQYMTLCEGKDCTPPETPLKSNDMHEAMLNVDARGNEFNSRIAKFIDDVVGTNDNFNVSRVVKLMLVRVCTYLMFVLINPGIPWGFLFPKNNTTDKQLFKYPWTREYFLCEIGITHQGEKHLGNSKHYV